MYQAQQVDAGTKYNDCRRKRVTHHLNIDRLGERGVSWKPVTTSHWGVNGEELPPSRHLTETLLSRGGKSMKQRSVGSKLQHLRGICASIEPSPEYKRAMTNIKKRKKIKDEKDNFKGTHVSRSETTEKFQTRSDRRGKERIRRTRQLRHAHRGSE